MLRTPSLTLPASLPHEKAIKSFRDNKYSYDPEFWEFQYHINRYLENVSRTSLEQRYNSIVKNMNSLITADRNVIPIQIFLSSWYWYRKEYQTRLEFILRKLSTPTDPPCIDPNQMPAAAPARPRHPNAGDVLFRWGKEKYMRDMLEQGRIRLAAASHYKELEGDIARQDEERAKHAFTTGRHVRLTTSDGKRIPVIGDLRRTVSAHNYFVLSMSTDWDIDLFKAFNADACVILKKPDMFAERFEKTAQEELPGWLFHHNPVAYYDPYENPFKQEFDATMCKDFSFAYQRECRFLFLNLERVEAHGFMFLDVGPLHDIAELHTSRCWV